MPRPLKNNEVNDQLQNLKKKTLDNETQIILQKKINLVFGITLVLIGGILVFF